MRAGYEALTSIFAVPPAGLEPAAYRLGGGRSIHLSYEGVARNVEQDPAAASHRAGIYQMKLSPGSTPTRRHAGNAAPVSVVRSVNRERGLHVRVNVAVERVVAWLRRHVDVNRLTRVVIDIEGPIVGRERVIDAARVVDLERAAGGGGHVAVGDRVDLERGVG
jgi:hypothetical protein